MKERAVNSGKNVIEGRAAPAGIRNYSRFTIRYPLSAALFFFAVQFLGAQAAIPVAVMPFAGDDPAINSRVWSAAFAEVESLGGFAPQPVEGASPLADEPPDSGAVAGTDYVLTGEYYFDDEDMQHFQMWLWNSGDGALVYTDELMGESEEEAGEYLPTLVAWVFSKVAAAGDPAEETWDEWDEPADEPAEGPAGGSGAGPFPRLYLGARGGAALDFQAARASGDYDRGMGRSASGEWAVTAEYQPWRFLSFQAEGVFILESLNLYTMQGQDGLYTEELYRGKYLMFPVLVKVPLALNGFRLSPLAGAYYALPLGISMGGASYGVKAAMPLGVTAGFDLGWPLGGGKYGEVYGSVRYNADLGLYKVEATGLQYTRSRAGISLGWRYGLLKK
jgi:hypothetical protein